MDDRLREGLGVRDQKNEPEIRASGNRLDNTFVIALLRIAPEAVRY
ncbi:MAG TPA: hypothetical protein VGS10_08735 [Terracidiphilus sp.]|nr:hypothetical protein [Terracidiphilus sp.]